MRRRPLEVYIEILRVLSQQGPLRLTHLMRKTNLNCRLLKENLSFLVKQALVEERTIENGKVIFVITQRGFNAAKYFPEPTPLLLIEGAQN